MTDLRLNSINDKLLRLRQNADFIDDIMKNRRKQLENDRPLYNGLEHLLQIAIEIILDIGSHILVEEFHEAVGSYEEIIAGLGEKGIITADFAKEQAGMAGFRNFIVHDYDKVNPTKVIEYAIKAPEIFRSFGSAFIRYFETKQK